MSHAALDQEDAENLKSGVQVMVLLSPWSGKEKERRRRRNGMKRKREKEWKQMGKRWKTV